MRNPHERCLVMGVLNVTPDSFSDGGVYNSIDAAVLQARTMIAAGADIIDIGGESTRPGAAMVTEAEEQHRILPVIAAIRRESVLPVSVDTRNAGTARLAIAEGADIINDISALRHDPRMAETAAAAGVPVILMHMQGTPATMQRAPQYTDVTGEVIAFFEERLSFARDAGISHLVIDPGIGFGKTLEHNLQLLRELPRLGVLGCSVLVGTSRKSFLGALTGADTPDRLPGSIASNLHVWERGAAVLRVHDVRAMRDALTVAEAIAGYHQAFQGATDSGSENTHAGAGERTSVEARQQRTADTVNGGTHAV
ncbi:MAG: dihydropteroate synthase [Bacteroidetes bacterium]|nr:dihydropteroate synthase [Bacteroidota bacterium]